MNFKLKPIIFNQLTQLYINNNLILDLLNETTAQLIIKEDEKFNYLFPYFSVNIKRMIRLYFKEGMREGFDPVRKITEENNQYFIELAHPFEEAKSIIIKEFKNMCLDLSDELTQLVTPIVVGTKKDDFLMCDTIQFPLDWFDESSDSLIEFQVLNYSDWSDLQRLNPQAKNIKYNDYSNGFSYSSHINELIYFVLLKNNLVIGLSECRISNNKITSYFTSLLDTEQGKGYSNLILENKINYAKSHNLKFEISSYTNSGFFKLRPNVLKHCQEKNVELIETGLFDIPKSIEEEIYYIQLKLKEAFLQYEKFKNENIYLNFETQLNILQDRALIEKFLKLNPYDFKSKEDLLNDWSFFSKFTSEERIEILLNK
jgi:hypothetical protein